MTSWAYNDHHDLAAESGEEGASSSQKSEALSVDNPASEEIKFQ